jgi:tetratricopeptide (TPR) repeat protein
MGSLRFIQKDYDKSAQSFQKALQLDPNSADALRGMMNVFIAQNQPERAIATVNAQIAKSPNNSGFYNLLGTVLYKNKHDLAGAETAFAKAVELEPKSSGAIIKLGEVQAARGETDQAIATYQRATQDLPTNSDLQVLLGELYEFKKDWSNAQAAYQKALAIKPSDPLASNNLAHVMVETNGNLDLALSLAQTARRGMPDSPRAAETLGQVYYEKQAYTSAVGLFQEALKLSQKQSAPDNPSLHYHLGLAYAKANQPALARQQLELVLKLDPNYHDADAVKKELAQLKS